MGKITKDDRETESEQMWLEKWHQLTCLMMVDTKLQVAKYTKCANHSNLKWTGMRDGCVFSSLGIYSS